MIKGLGLNLEIQEKTLTYKFITMKIVSVCLHNIIVNTGIMLICMSCSLAFYLTPITKADATFMSAMHVKLTSNIIPDVWQDMYRLYCSCCMF